MHETAITLGQLSSIREEIEIFGRVDEGPLVATIGKHPRLGSCIVLEPADVELVLLSEFPFQVCSRSDLPH